MFAIFFLLVGPFFHKRDEALREAYYRGFVFGSLALLCTLKALGFGI